MLAEYIGTYQVGRFLFLRVLGLTYLFAFLSAALQVKPLLGENGLTPATTYLERLRRRFATAWEKWWQHPTLFWLDSSDNALRVASWIGVGLSLLVTLGLANAPLLVALWALYLSIVKVGQVWYGYGWESQLLETGLLAVFVAPPLNPLPFSAYQAPVITVALAGWLVLRVYLGAGLIKLRGDESWRDLTALQYHFETQPLPNPLSPYFHHLPDTILNGLTFLTHVVQLGAPWLLLGPPSVRAAGAIILVGFQLVLMLSGNLSFLNLVTIAPALLLIPDTVVTTLLPGLSIPAATWSWPWHAWAYAVIIAYLSIPVVRNLCSNDQRMNASFNQFHICNTYGAFGSVTKERRELVIQGTRATNPTSDDWKTYEFPAKPTDTRGGLPVIAPYQPRLDWQLWFAAFTPPSRQRWLHRFLDKLKANDEHATDLVETNPFHDDPPRKIRVQYYRYHLNPASADQTWSREYLGEYLPPR